MGAFLAGSRRPLGAQHLEALGGRGLAAEVPACGVQEVAHRAPPRGRRVPGDGLVGRGDGVVAGHRVVALGLDDRRDVRQVGVRPTVGVGHDVLAVLVQMLNMFKPYDIGGMGYGSAAAVHLMVEAERRAYADRATHLGDSDFYPVPVDMLTDPEYAQHRMASFDPHQATPSAEVGAGKWPAEEPNTTQLAAMDDAGNTVSYTTTLNLSYGTKITVAGAGFLLNDEMDDFSSKPGVPNAYGLIGAEANAIEPHKRMLSSMTPTIVTKGNDVWLATGSPGGSTIITTTLQVIVNSIDHGMPLNDAVGLPRFHSQWKPDNVWYEPYGLSPDTLKLLKAMGHKMVPTPWGTIGDANSVKKADGLIEGMSDPRNDGGAAAY